MAGRPTGTSLVRKNIGNEEFQIIMNFVINDEKLKKQTKSNILKSCYLLYYFAFRVGEVATLKGKNIKQAVRDKVISLSNNTKTKKPREAYIDNAHIGVLEEVFQNELEEDDDFYLIRPWGNPREHYSPTTLQRLINNVIHQAMDSKQYSTHSFRAGYITEMYEEGINIKVIKEFIGHTKEATTLRYITVSKKSIKKAIKSRESVPAFLV